MISPLADRFWLWIAASLYAAGFLAGTWALLKERHLSRAVMYFLIAAGFTLQTFGLYLRGQTVHGCPIGNTFEMFQFTAWSATSLFLVIGPTFRLSLLGYFTSCLAATMTLLSLATPGWDATTRINAFGGNPWIEFHAALAIFSYGVFGLLALTSGMYLLQLYSLKNRNIRGVFSFLPSILDLDHINIRLLTFGVVLMSAAMAVGSVYWLRDTSIVHSIKIVTTTLVWLAYAVVFLLRARSLLIARRLAWTCIVLFAAALLSLKPVNSSRQQLPPPLKVSSNP